MFALSGFCWARCVVTICLALLKSLSNGALLAWIAKYFRANWLRGKSLTWILHHSSGCYLHRWWEIANICWSFCSVDLVETAGEAGWICDNFRMLSIWHCRLQWAVEILTQWHFAFNLQAVRSTQIYFKAFWELRRHPLSCNLSFSHGSHLFL